MERPEWMPRFEGRERRMKRIDGSATTAAVGVVVFLLVLLAGGCESAASAPADRPDAEQGGRRHRRVERYSKIPSNYPATWQTETVGH